MLLSGEPTEWSLSFLVKSDVTDGISRLYAEVPAPQVEKLKQFRAANPYKRVTISDVEWEYIVAGQEGEAILLLPGALGTGEGHWQHILRLEKKYRVVSPSYASVPTMGELIDGIVQILELESATAVHVHGGSYGGFVAQVFVRRHPERTKSLVLSHTLPPDPDRGRKIASIVRWLPFLPYPLLRSLFRKRMSSLLPKDHHEADLFRAYFEETLRYLITKKSLINGYRRVVDFDSHYVFQSQDLAGWPGRVLLIMSDDDPATSPDSRKAMQNLYPNADVHMFSGTGHAAALLKQDEYFSVFEQFLESIGGRG